jgi:hypothetical protein
MKVVTFVTGVVCRVWYNDGEVKMFTCKCGCAEVLHSDKWGCGNCGCMHYAVDTKGIDFDIHIAKDAWQSILTARVVDAIVEVRDEIAHSDI